METLGNRALLDAPNKVAFLSSRKIAPDDVLRCSASRASASTAAVRNRWILQHCNSVYLGALDPSGKLARQMSKFDNIYTAALEIRQTMPEEQGWSAREETVARNCRR